MWSPPRLKHPITGGRGGPVGYVGGLWMSLHRHATLLRIRRPELSWLAHSNGSNPSTLLHICEILFCTY